MPIIRVFHPSNSLATASNEQRKNFIDSCCYYVDYLHYSTVVYQQRCNYGSELTTYLHTHLSSALKAIWTLKGSKGNIDPLNGSGHCSLSTLYHTICTTQLKKRYISN